MFNETQRGNQMNQKPQVGQIIKVHGQDCRIFKIRPFGTVDVVTLDGKRAYRVSGLAF